MFEIFVLFLRLFSSRRAFLVWYECHISQMRFTILQDPFFEYPAARAMNEYEISPAA